MNKLTEFIEKNVQWVALALGGLFVLFMAYTYVLQSPAKVKIQDQEYTAGEIDEYTVDHVVKQLEEKINTPGTVVIPVPKHVEKFTAEMTWMGVAPDVNGELAWNVQTKDVTLPAPPPNPNAPPGAQPNALNPNAPPGAAAPDVAGKVAELPEPPAAKWEAAKFGRSVVIPPLAPGQQAVVPAQVLPGQPPPPGAVDKDWVTQLFKINMADLDKAFQDKHLPQGFTNTLFLQVELQREELDSNGAPVANSLTTVTPLNPPVGVWRQGQAPPPFPAAGNQQAQALYLAWASQNTPDILEPLFYTTIPNQGDQWAKPGQQVDAAAVFNPLQFLVGPIPDWATPEQKEAIRKARQEEYKRKQDEQKSKRPPPQPRAPRGPTGGPGLEDVGGGRNYAPAAPVRPAPPPPYRQPGGRGGAFPLEGDDMGGFGPGGFMGGPGAVAPPNLPQPGTDYPQGEFDAHDPKWTNKQPNPMIEVWAHDETAKAGKTYHYRIVYKIRNPLFGAVNVAQNPALGQVFEIASKPSDWSSPINIPQLVNFFVQSSKSPNANTVRFDVFRWDKGQQKQETFIVGPGDQIGGMKNGVDFSTDWTVVDFRFDDRQNDWQILIVNKEGRIAVRSYRADQGDMLYQGLKKQVLELKALLQPTAAAPGGTPGGGPAIVR